MAGDLAVRALDWSQQGNDLVTGLEAMRATRMKATAGRKIPGIGYLAAHVKVHLDIRIDARDFSL